MGYKSCAINFNNKNIINDTYFATIHELHLTLVP